MNQMLLSRLGHYGFVVLVGALGGKAVYAGAPLEVTAYFSLEGDVVTAGDQLDFNFDLSRSVDGSENLGFRTWASGGGTNAAGDAIASGGIDSVLELFDAGNASRGFNDDAFGLDSYLTWSPIQTNGTPLNPDPLTAGGYRLHLNEFNNDQAGAWALDLVGPADALQMTGITPTGTATIGSLKFGTDAGGGAAATFNQSGTLTVAGALTVAQTGDAVFNNTGSTTVNSLTSVNSGGTLNANAGSFNANGGVQVNGGTLNASISNFSLASGTTLSASNGAQIQTTGNLFLNSSRTINLGTDADMTHTGQISVGAINTGTLSIDGAGTTFIQNGPLLIGQQNATGTLTVQNAGLMDVNGLLYVAVSSTSGATNANLNVLSGGTVTTDSIRIGDTDGDQGSGAITVDGANSSLTQSSAATLTIGNADTPGNNGSHSVVVSNAGTFNASAAGSVSILQTGELRVNTGGLFTAQTPNPGKSENGAAGGSLTSAAPMFIEGGTVRLNGGNGWNGSSEIGHTAGANGGVGGGITMNNGANLLLRLSSDVSFDGGKGGNDYIVYQESTVAGNGGNGGTAQINGGVVTLNDTDTSLTFNGGDGGKQNANFPLVRGGQGGQGGTINIAGGSVTLSTDTTISARGGNGGDATNPVNTDYHGGYGGQGGSVNLSSGFLIVNGGTLDLDGGDAGLTANLNNKLGGDGGLLTVTGGVLVLNSGLITLTGGDGSSSPGTINLGDGTLALNGGHINAGKTLTPTADPINFTGVILNQTDGIIDIKDNATIQGGTLTRTNGQFNLFPNKRLTAAADAQITLGFSNFEINDGKTLKITTGADFSTGSVGVGNGSTGTLIVDGAGSTLSLASSSSNFGDAGGSADVTISAGGTMSGGSNWHMRNGSFTVSDAGSSVTQGNTALLSVGPTISGAFNLNVSNNATYTTGSDYTEVLDNGTINVLSGATFNNHGSLKVQDGGTIDINGGTFNHTNTGTSNLFAGGTLKVRGGGTLKMTDGSLTLDPAATFDGTGGTVFLDNNAALNAATYGTIAFGTLRVENSATANLPTLVGVDILIQDDGILNPSSNTSSQFFVNDVQDFDSATFQGGFSLGATTVGASASSMILGTNDVLTVKGISTVGFNKFASLSVNDGTFNADGGLLIGYNVVGGAGASGTVTINAGTLHATSTPSFPLAVGVGGTFSLAGNTGNSLILNDGELIVDGMLYVAPGNSFTMANGELDAGVLFYEGALNITNGGVKLNALINNLSPLSLGVVNLGNASLTIGTTRSTGSTPLSPTIIVDAGDSLTAANIGVGTEVDALLEISGGGTVNSTAGTSTVGDGGTGGSTGTVNISGTDSAWNIGGNGLDIGRGTVSVGGLAYLTATDPGGEVEIMTHGILRGNGIIATQAGVFNDGTIIIDEAVEDFTIYLLAINGNYTQEPDGRIEVGMVTGDPRLDVMYVTDGLMSLAGELAFDPTDDYSALPMYTSYSVLFGNGSTTRSGVFDTVSGADLGDGTGLGIIYGGSTVNAQHAIIGDLNYDGFVGIADLNIVLGNWNQSVDAGAWGAGDPSGDGFVGINDLNAVLGNWNNGTPPSGVSTQVPEPATAALLMLGALAMTRRRW
ncbi:MAG: PEP-CTERM sorting domain-containing protein [Phycisphaerales bacterium]